MRPQLSSVVRLRDAVRDPMEVAGMGPDPKTWPLGGIRNSIALKEFWRFASRQLRRIQCLW